VRATRLRGELDRLIGRKGSGRQVHGEAKVFSDTAEEPADVALGAEPERSAVGEADRKSFGSEPATAIPGSRLGSSVKMGARIGHLEYLRMGIPDGVLIGRGQGP